MTNVVGGDMKKDIHGRTRVQWAFQWLLWWGAVALAVFLGFQLSRPLWDADKLIQEKQQSCEKAGMIMVKEDVRFGGNYSCTSRKETLNNDKD